MNDTRTARDVPSTASLPNRTSGTRQQAVIRQAITAAADQQAHAGHDGARCGRTSHRSQDRPQSRIGRHRSSRLPGRQSVPAGLGSGSSMEKGREQLTAHTVRGPCTVAATNALSLPPDRSVLDSAGRRLTVRNHSHPACLEHAHLDGRSSRSRAADRRRTVSG